MRDDTKKAENEETAEPVRDMKASDYGSKLQQRLCDLYDTHASMKEFNECIIKGMKAYLEKQALILMHHTGADKDDLFQEGVYYILRKSGSYNPHKSTPVTFFAEGIKGAMKKEAGVKNILTSPYYVILRRELDKVAMSAGYEDAMDPKLTVQALAGLSGKSVTVVRNCLAETRAAISSYDNLGAELTDEYHSSPEKQIVEEEQLSQLRTAMKDLTNLQQVVLHLYFEDKNASFSSVRKQILDNEEITTMLGITTITTAEVEQSYTMALQTLRGEFRYGKGGSSASVFVEQAPADVVTGAIMSGMLDDD